MKTYKYLLTYKCGHRYFLESFGKCSIQELTKEQRLASQTLCPRCEMEQEAQNKEKEAVQ